MNKDVLVESLGLVAGYEDALTRRFYEILFDRYPSVRPMFSADIKPQASMLTQAVVAVLEHLEDDVWLAGTLGSLGAKHKGYGVTADMYPAVGECMIAAMAERGGELWTDTMTEEWSAALTAISGLMLAGTHEAVA